jgi:LacI family gluconate utilization system Gnt-I transcriptional repressor
MIALSRGELAIIAAFSFSLMTSFYFQPDPPDPANPPLPASPSRKRVTLTDVARHVGVGPMTVSRALRKPEMVSLHLRSRILKAVDELGYVRNRVASGLASGTARLVPVIIPTLHHSVYVPFLEGLYSVLPEAGYQILLGTTEYLIDQEEQLVSALLGWFPDGLLLSGVDHSARSRKMLERVQIPVVEVMDISESPIDMNIGFSHHQVGVAVAEYLSTKGYREIAYAGTLSEIDLRSVKRIAGFRETLKDRGLSDHLIQGSTEPSSIALGSTLLDELLRKYPQVQAIFFANDDLAAGALFECQRRGIRVPEHLAIMGFNDQEIASEVVPAITSVATPRREIGLTAARMLVDELRGKAVTDRRVNTGFRIIERGST